jgi:nucleoside-diphosphate-sugar epimerase
LAGIAHDLKKTRNSDEYFNVNTKLTNKIFDAFKDSQSTKFIYFSSVKAVKDFVNEPLTEMEVPDPRTIYGKSKLAAEKYILSKELAPYKQFYILRPCMIHGPGNKGNLNLLYKTIIKGFPWPLASFQNKKSFCSIENLFFIINEIIDNNEIESGIYNISDDDYLSTNQLIDLIGISNNIKPIKWYINRSVIKFLALIGDILWLPFNSDNLKKLTENYIVDNEKIKKAIGKKLPLSISEGLSKTFNNFSGR